MADKVKRTKAIRVSKMSSFTRKKNHLQQLLDGGGNPGKLKKVYEELETAYKVLEQAQEDALIAVGEEVLDTEVVYMDGPATTLADMDVKISTAEETHSQQKAEQQTREEAAANEAKQKKDINDALTNLRANIEAFGEPSTNLTQLSTGKSISYVDMRSEMSKLEESFAKLLQDKTTVLRLDPSIDLSRDDEKLKLVSDELERCKLIALDFLKDAPLPAATVTAEPTGWGRTAAMGFSSTKRETFMLPKFSGEEKTAYLDYPVWKKQSESHIVELKSNTGPPCFSTTWIRRLKSRLLDLRTTTKKRWKALTNISMMLRKLLKLVSTKLKVIQSFIPSTTNRWFLSRNA